MKIVSWGVLVRVPPVCCSSCLFFVDECACLIVSWAGNDSLVTSVARAAFRNCVCLRAEFTHVQNKIDIRIASSYFVLESLNKVGGCHGVFICVSIYSPTEKTTSYPPLAPAFFFSKSARGCPLNNIADPPVSPASGQMRGFPAAIITRQLKFMLFTFQKLTLHDS